MGGDGGRGVASHDSRPTKDSEDSVGDLNFSIGTREGAASRIFG
jgi:hypothetical protein